jgi:hypothetical protein
MNQINIAPIPMPVRFVRKVCDTQEGWSCDVTFGVPGFQEHDDPTITVSSKDVERYPEVGDIMLVFPPRVVGFCIAVNEK